jgi:uncharacterized protein (UPF0276 family)
MGPSDLGVGVVWWPPLDALCHECEGLVDVIEVEPEAYWAPVSNGREFRSFLPGALAHLRQPKLLHGVGAPVGGPSAPPEGHATAMAADVAALRPDHVSEHLSFTRFDAGHGNSPMSAGFMLPPLQSPAGVAMAAANIRAHRKALGGVRIAVETPVSYLPPLPGELPDGAFIAAVVEAADCGILLDLHNVLCNARNGRQSVVAFCDELPLERVWELHLAGGEREGEFYVDAHSGLVEPELMEIAAALIPRLPQLRAMIFEIMPERVAGVGLTAIGHQLRQIRDLWNTRATDHKQHPKSADTWPSRAAPLDPQAWTRLLGSATSGATPPALDQALASWWHSCAPALDLYRLLVGEGRASAVAAAAPRTTRLLLRRQGGASTRRLLAEFWQKSPQGYMAVDEARAFLQFLSAAGPVLPGLAEAVAQDAAELTELCSRAE